MNNVPLFLLVIFLTIFGFVCPAVAQFGVEGVPDTPPPQPAVSQSARVSPEGLPITTEDAIATFRELQAAYINNDAEYLLSILADPEKSEAMKIIKKDGLAYYLSNGQDLIAWQLRCVACWEDAVEGRLCAIEDRRWPPSKRNEKYFPGLYALKRINGTTYITEKEFPASKRARKLKQAMKKNGRICDIDKKNVPKAKADPSTLLRGLGAVLGEISK